MTVFSNVKQRADSKRKDINVAREAAIHIAYFLSGLMISRGAILGSMAPFGASFSAAIPFSYMPAGLLGAAIGYLLLSPMDSFRYIAIVISIGALRWTLNELKKLSENRIYPAAVAFVPVFATGAALILTRSSEISELSSCFIEAAIAAAGAYFMSRAVTLSLSGRGLRGFSAREVASVVMTGCILLLSLSKLKIGEVSAGRILAELLVMISARYGGVAVGAVAGCAVGAVFSLSENSLMFLSPAYSLSGLIGGLFAPVGKAAVALSAVVCTLIFSFSSGSDNMIFAALVESLAAAGIFMLIPKDFGATLTAIFSDRRGEVSEQALKRNITMRLSHSARALSNVSSCVNSVSDRLSKLYTPNSWWIYEKASDNVCHNCGMRVYCWQKEKELTVDDFHRLTPIIKAQGFVKEKDIEENFLKRCCKTGELARAVNQSYLDYLSFDAAQKRITAVRSVIAGQFSGLSEILEDLSVEFEECESFDQDACDRIIASLSEMGLTVIDCVCKKVLGRGMTVELEIVVGKKTALSKSQLSKAVGKACGRFFESPTISFADDRARVALCERPLYDIEIGSAQHIADSGELCGDCLNYFNNGAGSAVALISDGMGTGGRAAVDSNMAVSIMTKLLKAGLSYDCSLAVVNSSLMIKSEDETLATLDVTDFNLFTGKAELFKAGASTTYIRKNSKLLKKDMPSLPVGILTEAKFSKEAVTLTEGDMIVMVSDGAISGSDEWLCRTIQSFGEGSAEDLSSYIVEEAAKRRGDHDDDITAVAMKVVVNG